MTKEEAITKYIVPSINRTWNEKKCKKILEALEQEPKWIPVSKRLPNHPENNDYYIVTIQCEHHDGWDDYVTGFAEWTKHGWDILSYFIGQIKVVAWMPLPKSYEPQESEG